MSKIYPEIFTTNQNRAFLKLKSFSSYGYLAGGTALALQINHRKSADFDIFINKAVSNKLRLKIKKELGQENILVNSGDQITFITPDSVKITFVWYYFPLLKPTLTTNSLSLASIIDIAADKAHTIGRRAIWRDYVDVFVLLKEQFITLNEIIKNAQKKFKNEFSEILFLQQLTYFADIIIDPIEFIQKNYQTDEIKQFLESSVKAYLAKRK